MSLLALSSVAFAANNTRNTTADVPGYWEKDKEQRIFCRDSIWTDVAVFYLGNYVAHAATIFSEPGQSFLNTCVTTITALLLPGVGVVRGARAILSKAILADTPMEVAARAGALCAVIKVPPPGSSDDGYYDTWEQDYIDFDPEGALTDSASNGKYPLPSSWNLETAEPIAQALTVIHGIHRLPQGYRLVVLPRNTKLEDKSPSNGNFWKNGWQNTKDLFLERNLNHIHLTSSHNFAKAAISAAQLVYALATLYRTQSYQVKDYGYAAYGLSVVPYAWMSLINLVGNLMCPRYQSMYLVRSPALNTLEKFFAKFPDGSYSNVFWVDGTIGRIDLKTEKNLEVMYIERRKQLLGFVNRLKWLNLEQETDLSNTFLAMCEVAYAISRPQPYFDILMTIFIAFAPFIAVAGLTGFRTGNISQPYQNVVMLMWILFGAVIGPILAHGGENAYEPRPILGGITQEGRKGRKTWIFGVLAAAITVLYSVPAIAGLVIVGYMMEQDGVCSEIPDKFLALSQAELTAFGNPTQSFLKWWEAAPVPRTGYWEVPERDISLDTPANLGDFWVFINGFVLDVMIYTI
ncbi:hypothetical protein B0T25DRAFT_617853 [Lasiosphaeria hispida]|uniref:Uncharacterized protein n=1 Tax=Lasiosphaeria hispida TaxID=260671 RepID=A0AAJ0H7K5_9PEZI|nr:hypothetical protein B0T25DRAFT_617853 [Lasiosphaeria hispida]